MKYHITPGNRQYFKASFYDTECVDCTTPIEEGDPTGFIREPTPTNPRNRYGPLCYDCLDTLAEPFQLDIKKK